MPLVEAKHGDLAATNGVVRSHRFTAANTALPWLRGDSGMLAATEKFLRKRNCVCSPPAPPARKRTALWP